jgi:cystathionine beta-lyase/cystathionine gamma-synthase
MNFKDIKGFFIGAIVVASSLSVLAVSVPNIFTAGTPIKAADVNTNFGNLKTAVDALEAKVASLETKGDGTAKGTLRAFVIATGAAAISNQYSATGGTITVTSASTGAYSVTIPGVNYFFRDHPTTVTPLTDGIRECTVRSNGDNKVTVTCYSDTGSLQNSSFTLMVFNK